MAPMRDDSRPAAGDAFAAERRHMVATQVAARGVRDPRVLAAMSRVPRHRFVAAELLADAYADCPLPIGHGQTISQPYIVGLMVEALRLPDGARVLEIGTGSGYQAAVLRETGFVVFTVEILPPLAGEASERLAELGYGDIRVLCGDGALGWASEAPFDGIVVAAAPRIVPPALFDQLAVGGRLIVPVGGEFQELWSYRRTSGGLEGEELLAVRFVPMTGAAR